MRKYGIILLLLAVAGGAAVYYFSGDRAASAAQRAEVQREAQNSELRALLNYRKALVEFDRVQQAGAR